MTIYNSNNKEKSQSKKLTLSKIEDEIPNKVKQINRKIIIEKLQKIIIFIFIILIVIYFIYEYIESTIPDCCSRITFF
jgi:cell division septal protein FtsQ